MEQDIISELRKIVGNEYVITEVSVIIGYHCTSDRAPATLMDHTGKPMGPDDLAKAIVRPSNVNEVSRIAKLLNGRRIPIRVQSAGTGIHGGSTPQKGEVILDLSRMNWIRVNEEEGYVEFGPAVKPLKANEVLNPLGYWFPVYPTTPRVASVGGIISINTSGHSVDSLLGKPGDYVLGLQVVLSTGEIIETGTKTLRRPAGPDFTRFFIGTEGLFGIITNVYYRLVRRPTEQIGALVIFPSIPEVTKTAQRVLQERVPYPFYFEFMDETFTKQSYNKEGIISAEGTSLLIAVGGDAPKEAEWKLERILDICKQEGAIEIHIIDGTEEWDKISGIRQTTQRTIKRMVYAGAIDPPLSKITEVYMKASRLKDKVKTIEKVDYYAIGHLGGPSLHPCFPIPTGLDDSTRWKLIEELRDLTIDFALENKSSWGEQGMFPHQTRFWIKRYGIESYKLLKRLKKTFDPNNILNRGNLIEIEKASKS